MSSLVPSSSAQFLSLLFFFLLLSRLLYLLSVVFLLLPSLLPSHIVTRILLLTPCHPLSPPCPLPQSSCSSSYFFLGFFLLIVSFMLLLPSSLHTVTLRSSCFLSLLHLSQFSCFLFLLLSCLSFLFPLLTSFLPSFFLSGVSLLVPSSLHRLILLSPSDLRIPLPQFSFSSSYFFLVLVFFLVPSVSSFFFLPRYTASYCHPRIVSFARCQR